MTVVEELGACKIPATSDRPLCRHLDESLGFHEYDRRRLNLVDGLRGR